MAFYKDRIYPALVNRLGNPKPIQALRRQIIPLAHGIVLEIGVGAGANLGHYDRARVRRLYALEPNQGMRRLAETEQRRTSLDVTFLSEPGEHIPLEAESVDTVVSTFTLCTIQSLPDALRGIEKVLKPGGALIFIENSVATDPNVQWWQYRWEPILHLAFAGLFLTRDMPSHLVRAGFRLERMEQLYLTPFPKSWAHCCWGTARRSQAEQGSRPGA